MNENNLCNQIREFLCSVPDVIDVIGYGSGVKEQKNYSNSFQKDIDIIATVNNDLLWHQNNFKLNPQNYSKFAHISKLPLRHYGTDINYLAHLEYKSNFFKLGIVEKKDLIDDLVNWKNFYLAGRLQKSILEIEIDNDLEKSINVNRRSALIVALILNYKKDISLYELLYSICNLSFNKDIRMSYKMENPNKVKNILEGSYDELKDIYNSLNEEIFTNKGDLIIPNYNLIIEDFNKMPKNLIDYLNKYGYDIGNLKLQDLENLKELIIMFLNKNNCKTSTIQPIKSIMLNPAKKSIDYAFQKHMKYKEK